MVDIEVVLASLSQYIGYGVTIVGTGFMVAKYITSEINKKYDRLRKEILGPEGNAADGKGGYIDSVRQESKKDLKLLEERTDNKINKSQSDLISEYRLTVQKINYVVANVGRMERSLEKLTNGRYTAARQEINQEDGYNEQDNPDPNDDSMDDIANNFNKSRRRRGDR